jgi:hypothetical protein
VLGKPKAILLAIARAGLRADLQRHQLLGAKPIISWSKSASALFSTSERRFIMSSVIGGVLQVGLQKPDPTGKHW